MFVLVAAIAVVVVAASSVVDNIFVVAKITYSGEDGV